MNFRYTDERFADIQMLRYKLENFDKLSLRQKKLGYCLSQAALFGRDITFDQFGKYNLRIRKTLEAVYTEYTGDRNSEDFKALEVYLKRVWFSNGIYHHYGCDKFKPGFSSSFFVDAVKACNMANLPLDDGQTVDDFVKEIRMNRAADLLSDTSLSIGEIAHRLGYMNQGKFSTAFKMRKGIGPLEYRKRIKNLFKEA